MRPSIRFLHGFLTILLGNMGWLSVSFSTNDTSLRILALCAILYICTFGSKMIDAWVGINEDKYHE